MKKNSWFRVYSVVGQLTWLVLSPLLLFIGGGAWLVHRFNWDSRIIIVFVLLALAFAGAGVWSFAQKFINEYADLKKKPPKIDSDDYDY